jgi:hypothetical protein
LGVPFDRSILLGISMGGFDERVKGVMVVAIDGALDAVVLPNSGEESGSPLGVVDVVGLVSGVLPADRQRFLAGGSPELIGRAFFLVRPLPRPRPPRPRLI